MHDKNFYYEHTNSYLQPEDFWIGTPKKGIVVFALPGEPGLTELVGDFKIHFHDGQGDFYWFVDYGAFSKLFLLFVMTANSL